MAPGTPGFLRLSTYDLHCLAGGTPARPNQVGILAMLDGRALCDPSGRPRLAEIRGEIERRLAEVPELRRVTFRPGPLAGRPLWIDDPAFRIDQHVDAVEVAQPGDEAALLELTERLIAPMLDRARPLWRMWFVTGLPAGQIGVLMILHHALADGMTAMRVVRSLLEAPLPASAPARQDTPVAALPPTWGALVRDNIRTKATWAMLVARPATWRTLAYVIRNGWQGFLLARHAPRTSLNGPVGPMRRLVTLPLDRATAKRVAHLYGCGINDVVLSLIAAGVRALLEARAEPIEGWRPRVGIAVALFSPGHVGEAGNDIGALLVPLPIEERDPGTRLRVVAAERARAKRSQMVVVEPVFRAWLWRLGPVRRAMDRQRLVNLVETYLPGPPVPIHVLGAPVLDLLPIAPLAGNLGLSFVALSYAGRLTVTIRTDPDQFPDLEVLSAAMEREWDALAEAVAPFDPSRGVWRSSAGSAA